MSKEKSWVVVHDIIIKSKDNKVLDDLEKKKGQPVCFDRGWQVKVVGGKDDIDQTCNRVKASDRVAGSCRTKEDDLERGVDFELMR